jgi:hypothetical protein
MAPPCPLSRRVPQDVWETILDLKPRDRDMSSPVAALIKSIPRGGLPDYLGADSLVGWRVQEGVRDLIITPRKKACPEVRRRLCRHGLAVWPRHRSQTMIADIGRHPPCVVMSLGALWGLDVRPLP